MILKLRYHPDRFLRKECKKLNQIKDKHKILAAQMHLFMTKNHGIGLAAPQVGRDISLIVINTLKDEESGRKLTMFNPTVLEKSKELEKDAEGCLSIPNKLYKVTRPKLVTVQYVDQDSKECIETFTGLTGRCIQHEIDHLSGVLMIDYENS